MQNTLNLYETDFFAWTQEQVKLIRHNSLNELDLTHLQEEIESMGAREKRELGNRLVILLMHLLKWKYQPTKRTTSWELTIKVQRNELKYHLKNNPSLNNAETSQDAFEHAYSVAILKAAKETKLSYKAFPENCEWSLQQVLNDDFLPN